VVTTGTFTIPLMKRVGYRPKAGAVEVSSSVNGQIMPPVMGAAAFLMVEYVGIPYSEIIKHAFLPALISYIALFYIVHLEALKAGMHRPAAAQPAPLAAALLSLRPSWPASWCWPAWRSTPASAGSSRPLGGRHHGHRRCCWLPIWACCGSARSSPLPN
jgi:TRAP-type C4-dicarboxylate transport system permease large subunit